MSPTSPPLPSPASITSTSSLSHPLIPPHILLPPNPPHPHPTYTSYISTWSTPQITSFLASHKCLHHARSFEENDITGEVILELGEGELKELGVGKIGERVRLVSGIKGLRKRCAGVSVGSGRDSPISIRHYGAPLSSGSGRPTANGPGYGYVPSPSIPISSTSSHTQNTSSNSIKSQQNSSRPSPQLRLNNDPMHDRPHAATQPVMNGSGTSFSSSSLSRNSSLSSNARPGMIRRGTDEDRDSRRDRDRGNEGDRLRSSKSSNTLNQDTSTDSIGNDGRTTSVRNSGGSKRLNATRPPPLHLGGSVADNSNSAGSSREQIGSSGGLSSGNGGRSTGARGGSSRERERDGRVEIGSRDLDRRGVATSSGRSNTSQGGSGSAAARYAYANGHSGTTPSTPFATTPRGPHSQPLATSLSTDSNESSGSGGSLADYLASAIVVGQHTSSSIGNGLSATPLMSGRPSLSNSSSTSLTVTPGTIYTTSSSGSSSSGLTGNVPGPLPSSAFGTGLRAPSITTANALSLSGRRSPGPAPGDVSAFADRPLPGIPASGISQSDAYPAVTRGFGERRANLAAARQQAGRPSTSGQIGQSEATNLSGQRSHRRSGSLVEAEAGAIAAFGRSSHSRPSRPSTSGSTGSTHTTHERHPYANPEARAIVNKNSEGRHNNTDRTAYGSLATPTIADTRLTQLSRTRTGSTDHARGPSTAQMTLEDVRRKCVKFILADDGSSRVVNLDTCEGGMEALEKALRKFGKWKGHGVGNEGSESEGEGDESRSLSVDGWGVFLSEFVDENEIRSLTEAELLAICHADPDDPSRQNGLWLRRLRRSANRKDIINFLGENTPMSPTSPASYYPTSASRLGFPSPTGEKALQARNPPTRNINRASVISVLSGLGVPLDEATTPLAQQDFPAPARSPSTGNFLASKGKKMYNFFGHRPPSELISSHLADFFPAARRRDLEKGARNSMLRLDGKGSNSGSDHSNSNRASYGSGSLRNSLDTGSTPNRLPSRFSIASSSASSGRQSRHSAALSGSIAAQTEAIPEDQVLDTVPRLSISSDDHDDGPVKESTARPPLLPPFESGGESLSDSLKVYSPREGPSGAKPRLSGVSNANNRLSMASVIKRRRRSNVSMLTVDEITAEVDHRRASVISFGGSDDEVENALVSGIGASIDPGIAPLAEGEEEDEEIDDEEEEYESESEEEEEDEVEEEEAKVEGGEQGQKFTSAGANRSIKWSKGALVGSGSFGQVYLGLDLQKGLLMAVKQVDIRTGGNPASESRKKEMVVALQREVELLKELQHENIVQYLDSSTDESYLNIFLEYVPGGSVTALLRNYGAFEEALVRTFVRQILTGLVYLHGKGIIHRDIKGANILVDNKGGVKISDFGISKKVVEKNLKTNRPSLQGSAFWMAPEVVKQAPYTNKADIWSVGCLVLEMLTGEHPWPDLNQMQAFFRIGSPSPRPNFPADISAEATDMLERSFDIDHVKRPSASELLAHPFLTAE